MHLASILSLEFKRADFIIFFQSLFVYAHWSNNTAYFVAISHQTFPAMNYSKKNPNMIQGLSAWNFHSRGIEERAHENISVQLKRSGITGGSQRKNNVKFPWVLVFELGVSKGWHTILQNCQGWKLVFSKISKGKVTNLKIPERVFQKSVTTTQLVWSFSGIAQWAGEFDPKSQITILVAWQLELFQKKFQTRERVEDLKLLGVIFIMWKFQRSIKYIKKIAFPRVIKRSWFLALQVPWGVVELSQGWGVNLYFA